MNKVKSITLAADEVTAILSISDPEIREAALKAWHEALADPDNIDIDKYLDSHPVILNLVWKVYRRAETARLRAEKRAENKAAGIKTAAKKKESILKNVKPMIIQLDMSEGNVRRLLWLRQHLGEALGNVTRALMAQRGDLLGEQLSDGFTQVTDMIQEYLKPLMEAAAKFMRLPKSQRPSTIEVPVFSRA